MAERLKKGTRVTGAERDKLAADLKKRYDSGESIRALAAATGRSYGFIHRILTESRTNLRGRSAAYSGTYRRSANDSGTFRRMSDDARSGRFPSPDTSTRPAPHTGAALDAALSGTEPPRDEFAAKIAEALSFLTSE